MDDENPYKAPREQEGRRPPSPWGIVLNVLLIIGVAFFLVFFLVMLLGALISSGGMILP